MTATVARRVLLTLLIAAILAAVTILALRVQFPHHVAGFYYHGGQTA